MKKTHYLKELTLRETLERGTKGKDVKKVQEWLNIWRYIDPTWRHAVTTDGDFGQQTETIVKAFQQIKNLPDTGIVDQTTFDALCQLMRNAFAPMTGNGSPRNDLRVLIVAYAQQHLRNFPVDLDNRNEGPWVRA